MRVLLFLAPLLLPLSGCVDGGDAEPPAERLEPLDWHDAVRRVPLTEEGTAPSTFARTPGACTMDDYSFSIARRDDAFVRGHGSVELHVTVRGATTGLQFGHALDYEPTTWLEPVMSGEHQWTVEVSPEEWEPSRQRWSFWWRFAPGGLEDCNTGAFTEAFTFEAYALPR